MDSKLKCFLIEDSPRIRDRVIELMNGLQGVVVVGYADSEPGALDWLRSEEWDAVVVDLKIKDGSGIHVLEKLRTPEFSSKAKVVLTNYGYTELGKRCLALGADAFFDKSSDIDEFLAFIEARATAVRN